MAFLFLLCGNGSAQRHFVPDAIHRAFVQLSLAGQVSTRAALLQMLRTLQFGDLARIVEGIQIDSKQGPRWFLAELEVAMGFKGWSGDVREPERLWNCLARVLRGHAWRSGEEVGADSRFTEPELEVRTPASPQPAQIEWRPEAVAGAAPSRQPSTWSMAS
ncbi:MAG: hypothetical protein IPK26_08665 [Planctomycetes bacterium]|nr:hypothetical protein [Planctomycetota bacterium]